MYSLVGLLKNKNRITCLSIINLSLLFLLFQGCALRPIVRVEKERDMGAKEAQKVEHMMGLIKDPKLVGYVEELGLHLAKHSPRKDVDYRFHVVDMVEPNAFALPGGYIYVSRGLLTLVNEEEELVGVIAHEIAHVAAYHHAKGANASVVTSPFRIGTGILGAAAGILFPTIGEAIGGIGQVASALVIAPFSREQEREADRIGQEIAAQAGYDPHGLNRILETLRREEALHSKKPRQNSIFSTHPALRERVAKTKQHASKLQVAPIQPIAVERAELLKRLEGMLVGENPARGLFMDNQFMHPDLDFTLRFPPKWQTINTPSVVAAQALNKDILVHLQIVGRGEKPHAVVRDLGEKLETNLLKNAETIRIGSLYAVRTRLTVKSKEGTIGLDLTWIAHRGLVYQITGMCPIMQFNTYQDSFVNTAKSFRTLSEAERTGIMEARLRIVKAREEETLTSLIDRVDGIWTSDEAAVANAIAQGSHLHAGQLIKLSVQQRYKRRR